MVVVPLKPFSTSSSTVASSSRARIARVRSSCGTRAVVEVTGPAWRATNKQSSLTVNFPQEETCWRMTWHNWARTSARTRSAWSRPVRLDEVAAAWPRRSTTASPSRPSDSGHSFTGAAVAPGVQVLPDRLGNVHSIDSPYRLVTVGAGIALHRLNPLLAWHGLAMEILGDIDRQTIAGAVATRHPRQRRGVRQHLDPGCAAWSWCWPTARSWQCSRPSARSCSRRPGSRRRLGVITKVTLQCVPL